VPEAKLFTLRCFTQWVTNASNVLGRDSQGIRDNTDTHAGYGSAYSPHNIYYLDAPGATLDTSSTSDTGPDILTAKINCPELSFMHDTTNEKTSDHIPGTNAGTKTTLVTQFERFAAGLEYHVCSFFIRT
jgi:hypothetical protein